MLPQKPPPSRPRPRPQLRERALRFGLEAFDEAELLALVLGHGARDEPLRDRVERLLEEAGGLAGLASRGVGALTKELGLGVAAASRLAAAIELGLRVVRLRRETPLDSATTGGEVARWGRAHLLDLPHEEIWTLLLDARNRIVAERRLGRGGVHACAVTARDVLRVVVRENAAAFVLVHNHPSGDPCPSFEDVAFTRAIVAAAQTVGIACLDHVVVARDGCVSMREAQLLASPPSP
jgi:DNA repair protein RadC